VWLGSKGSYDIAHSTCELNMWVAGKSVIPPIFSLNVPYTRDLYINISLVTMQYVRPMYFWFVDDVICSCNGLYGASFVLLSGKKIS